MKCKKCQLDKELSDFYIRPDGNRPHSYCKICFNIYCKDRWFLKKKNAIQYKGGKCVDCNLLATDQNYVVFDFHHMDPSKKEFNWGKLRLRKQSVITKELDKCICLCSNCHRLRHFNEL